MSPDTSLFINRELSWLEFNARVLHEAFDSRNKLLERVKFLSIFNSNLDEFYMVRVAGLRRQLATGVAHLPPDGIPPQQLLTMIQTRVAEFMELQRQCLYDLLLPELAKAGIKIVKMNDLSQSEWQSIDRFFESEVFPVLTPLAVDPGHPFPYISNLSISLAVEIRDPERGEDLFARVKVPKSLPRWVPVVGRPMHFVPIEQVIGNNLGALFPGMEVLRCHGFRVTRYSDLELPVEEPEDLLATIEEQVFKRRFGEVVRLEVQSDMPPHLRALLLDELQARFDEANNITWARRLESFGVHVAYGSATLKTHTKLALVVRREGDVIRRYVHLGSGNYNSRTARLYTDVGLFTCSRSIAADVTDLFNSLTGYSRQRLYRKLLVAPANMRARVLDLIDREAEHARTGRPARIVAQMNALVDPEVIDALYRASRAGVDIDLIVRGICCLRPGVQGLSERIRVISIIGRFLEHSRVCYFANGGNEEFYIGSADWMQRNFDRRVEAVAPVEDTTLHVRLRSLLRTSLEDNRQAWELGADGSWTQRTPNGVVHATHEILLRESWGLPVPEHRHSGESRAVAALV